MWEDADERRTPKEGWHAKLTIRITMVDATRAHQKAASQIQPRAGTQSAGDVHRDTAVCASGCERRQGLVDTAHPAIGKEFH